MEHEEQRGGVLISLYTLTIFVVLILCYAQRRIAQTFLLEGYAFFDLSKTESKLYLHRKCMLTRAVACIHGSFHACWSAARSCSYVLNSSQALISAQIPHFHVSIPTSIDLVEGTGAEETVSQAFPLRFPTSAWLVTKGNFEGLLVVRAGAQTPRP
jgi:hypothetical protein